MAEDKTSKPMDTSINEQTVGTPHANRQRNAYALVQLVDEVRSLFPETPYEFSNYNGRNTAMSVTFDMTGMDNDDAILLIELLALIKADTRVLDVIEDDGQVLVDLFPSPRYQDIRDSFHLADAYTVLTEGF